MLDNIVYIENLLQRAQHGMNAVFRFCNKFLMQKQVLAYMFDIHLIWDIIGSCNFNCDYCLSHSNDTSEKPYPINAVKANEVLDASGKTYDINLVGGEPTLLPNFIEFCQEITKKHYLSISTNLFKSNIFYELIDKIDPKRIRAIDASLHIEQREKKSSVETFARTFLDLQNAGFNIYTNYVAHPRLFSRIRADFKKMNDLGIELKATPYIGTWNNKHYPQSYSAQERKLIFNENSVHSGKWGASVNEKETPATPVKSEIQHEASKSDNINEGILCNGGYNVFWIAQNGDISRCSTFLNEKYGNIFSKFNSPDSTLRTCKATSCPCPYYCVLGSLFEKAKKECFGA